MITLLFSCKACGLVDEPVSVRAREKAEDVRYWVEDVVGPAIQHQHLLRSLLCEARSCQNLKIPFDKDDPDPWIGKQTDAVPPKGDLNWSKLKAPPEEPK